MIIYNEGNTLDIKNERGCLSIEDDIKDGMTFLLINDKVGIRMTTLLCHDELKQFLNNPQHISILTGSQSKKRGTKKVLEVIFSTINIKNNKNDDYKITFISEDTTYYYYLTKEEWTEMKILMKWVINGYKE